MNLTKKTKKLKVIPVFPDDFKVKKHGIVDNSKHWQYPNENKTVISVVGGGFGLYGNGITTFEMYDMRESEPQGYLTKEEINEHLKNNPI